MPYCYSNIVGTEAHARRHGQNHKKSLESRTRQILEPNTLTEDQFDEHWRDVSAAFVKEGLESLCEQKCKKSRDSILKFSLLTMHAKLTRSRKRKWILDSIDHESSDAVKLKQLRDPMVQTKSEWPSSMQTKKSDVSQTTTTTLNTILVKIARSFFFY